MMTQTPSHNPAGFYSGHFTRAELDDLDRALGDSLRGEISMLRTVMRRFFERVSQEADDCKALAEALRALGLSVTRLRAAAEGVAQFKIFSGLASGGSGLMSLVALLKAFFGG